MPPKAKITRDMILNAAFDIVRTDGAENLSARTVAKKLNCSTQPVMYHFAKIEDLKRAVYEIADSYHTGYITKVKSDYNSIMHEVTLLYVRFSAEEKHLFRFLFQDNSLASKGLDSLMSSNEISPVLFIVQMASGVTPEIAREIFSSVFLFAHGCASMIANGVMEYNESKIIAMLKSAYNGAVYAKKADA